MQGEKGTLDYDDSRCLELEKWICGGVLQIWC